MRQIAIVCLLLLAGTSPAAIHYSGEPIAPLPSQWRGFLLDHRALRLLAIPPQPGVSPTLLAQSYQAARTKLLELSKQRSLTADESADLAALHLRLGQPDRALTLLQPMVRQYPTHFRLHAHLGTAWQLQGDLARALDYLQLAVELAPPEFVAVEKLHRRLVQMRLRQPKADGLDDLFGLTEKIADKLPMAAVATLQRLALSLPADGRLFWQVAEVAHALGDVRTAAAILDGCVGEFAMSQPALRDRRQAWRALVEAADADPEGHAKHVSQLIAKSPRPLMRRFDPALLPTIRAEGVQPLPWPILGETLLGNRFPPRYPRYLEQLDGRRVRVTGFLQPLGDDPQAGNFVVLEFPIGCWFCETPDVTSMISVEIPKGKEVTARQSVQLEGKLTLNRTDPESYLFQLSDVRLGAIE